MHLINSIFTEKFLSENAHDLLHFLFGLWPWFFLRSLFGKICRQSLESKAYSFNSFHCIAHYLNQQRLKLEDQLFSQSLQISWTSGCQELSPKDQKDPHCRFPWTTLAQRIHSPKIIWNKHAWIFIIYTKTENCFKTSTKPLTNLVKLDSL